MEVYRRRGAHRVFPSRACDVIDVEAGACLLDVVTGMKSSRGASGVDDLPTRPRFFERSIGEKKVPEDADG